MSQSYKRLKLACYSSNIAMSVVANLSPILFLTFHKLYNISYTMMGFLVLVNFITQLSVDLLFSFFSHKFDIKKTVRIMPVLTFIGLFIYAVSPFFLKDNVYIGIIIGTVIFSASSGLAEVLISPVIAAIPSDNPDREMSKLHSIYAWGVVFVVIISTLFLLIFGSENWQYLAMLFMIVPLFSIIMFNSVDIPKMDTPQRVSGALKYFKNKTLWLFVLAIFLGGASEIIMAQWSSGYLEQALGIPKVFGDIFGVAMFSLTFGLGRTLYTNFGKNIYQVLILGSVGATICYFVAAITNTAIVGLVACALTGFCVSMLWPGSLIVASDCFASSGVFIYAIMASGGDLGASIGPQLIGLITDAVSSFSPALSLSQSMGITPEQLGMKLGMFVGMLFPLLAIFIFIRIKKISLYNNRKELL